MSRALAKFAHFPDVSFECADISRMEAQGAKFTKANVAGANFAGMQVQSTDMTGIKGKPLHADQVLSR